MCEREVNRNIGVKVFFLWARAFFYLVIFATNQPTPKKKTSRQGVAKKIEITR